MSWKGFFEGIQYIAEEYLFLPFDTLRLQTDSWWTANIVSWILAVIGFAAFFYWMRQLAKFNASGEEDRTQVSHSFLGDD